MSRDETGFAEFFQESWDPCLRAVAASTGDMLLAEDQVAEAFARAWVSWRKVSRHPAPRAWVVRTALNAGASWWRRRARELPLADHDVAAPGSPGTGLDSVVLTALRRLPARQREVIVLRVFLDLDIETTAAAAGDRAGNGPRLSVPGRHGAPQRTRPSQHHGGRSMSDTDQMTDSAELRELRDSLSGVAMPERPRLETITARGRARRRHRLSRAAGLSVAGVAAGTALAFGLTGALGPAPVHGTIRTLAPGTIRTAAFKIVKNPTARPR